MKTIISAPFRATRGIASGVIRPTADDRIDPAFRRDFPAYCETVVETPDNVVDFRAEREKRQPAPEPVRCELCGRLSCICYTERTDR